MTLQKSAIGEIILYCQCLEEPCPGCTGSPPLMGTTCEFWSKWPRVFCLSMFPNSLSICCYRRTVQGTEHRTIEDIKNMSNRKMQALGTGLQVTGSFNDSGSSGFLL